MNTGTSIFLIVLVLIASFAGLGYLINQNANTGEQLGTAQTRIDQLEAEIRRLNLEIESLNEKLSQSQTETARERQAKEAALGEVQRLQAQVVQLAGLLEQERAARSQPEGSPNLSVSNPALVIEPAAALTPQLGSGNNLVTWLMLATLFIAMVTGWGMVLRTVRLSQPERTRRPQPAPEQPLTVRMTRQQMQEYIAWRRQHK